MQPQLGLGAVPAVEATRAPLASARQALCSWDAAGTCMAVGTATQLRLQPLP